MREDFTPHQQRIIRNYYANLDQVQLQKLSELVTELYLAEGKKKEKLWQSAIGMMQKLGIPQSRIDHLLAQQDPALLAKLVQELFGSK